MRRPSLKNLITEAAKRHKSHNGKVIVTRVCEDVFGRPSTTTRDAVSKTLDQAGIARIKFTRTRQRQPKLQPETQVESDTKVIPPETTPEIDRLEVEYYLAVKAKAGNLKAFRLLQRLV